MQRRSSSRKEEKMHNQLPKFSTYEKARIPDACYTGHGGNEKCSFRKETKIKERKQITFQHILSLIATVHA